MMLVPLWTSFSAECLSKKLISDLINIFFGVHTIPSAADIKAVPTVSILMLKLKREQKEHVLKTMTSQELYGLVKGHQKPRIDDRIVLLSLHVMMKREAIQRA